VSLSGLAKGLAKMPIWGSFDGPQQSVTFKDIKKHYKAPLSEAL